MLKRKFKPLLAKLGIRIPRGNVFHAFRHANATMTDRLGTPQKIRQVRLGHTDPHITQAIYAHVAGEDSRRVAAQLGEAVWGILDANGRKKENGSGLELPNPFRINQTAPTPIRYSPAREPRDKPQPRCPQNRNPAPAVSKGRVFIGSSFLTLFYHNAIA